MTSDEAVLHTGADVCQRTVFQNNAAFDLAVLDGDIVIDTGEGADVTVFDDGIFTDNRRATYHTVDDFCAFFDGDTPVNL